MLTLYFSRSHGIQMNTTELETKQGADSSADLPTQPQPQLKVVEPKLSAASSHEEKLVAGVSMIGLQTKRLSGAQQKRLTLERKMREGTWTVEKPPGKTHSSQAKGVVESSGGVKRPHSDLSTPSQGKEQLQKLRCRLRYTRKLQLESRWRTSTDTILK